MLIRNKLIELFKETGSPLPLLLIAERLEIAAEDIAQALDSTPKLNNLMALTPDEASMLINYYGQGVLFDKCIEEKLMEYQLTRNKLKEIEHRTRGS